MATLIEALTPRYSEQASVLTGNPNRVTVEVEDNIDEEFWGDILRGQCPEKEFHFMTFQTILKGKEYVQVKGKSRIMKMSDSFNDFHIGCVDSDYDWLLSDTSEYGKTLTSTPYLLQTYAYSIENLMCLPETLSSLVQNSCDEDTDYNFSEYFTKLSRIIHPLLVWSVYLTIRNLHDFTPDDWHIVLPHDSSDLKLIESSVNGTIRKLRDIYPSEKDEVTSLSLKLKDEKGVDETTAYLYVQGHAFYNHIFRAILQPLINSLFKRHIDGLTSNIDKKTYSQSVKYRNIEKLLSHNYSYKPHINLYNVICSDIVNIWK